MGTGQQDAGVVIVGAGAAGTTAAASLRTAGYAGPLTVVGAEGRDGRDFAVVAGDGTVQPPPDLLERYPAGTLFTVDDEQERVVLTPHAAPAVS